MTPRWVTKRRGRAGWTWGIDGVYTAVFATFAFLIVFVIGKAFGAW